jgi:hypothetical protein
MSRFAFCEFSSKHIRCIPTGQNYIVDKFAAENGSLAMLEPINLEIS